MELPFLKIARITNPDGASTTEQVEIDLSADFSKVHDVAFLSSPDCCGPRIAVIGNTFHHVPDEWVGAWWYRGEQPPVGREDCHLRDHPKRTPGSCPLGSTSYSEWFDTTWSTNCTDQADPDCGGTTGRESYQITGLSSGGFVVAANGTRNEAHWGDDLGASLQPIPLLRQRRAIPIHARGRNPLYELHGYSGA